MPKRLTLVPAGSLALLAGGLGLLAGCGNSRTPVPTLTNPAQPRSFRTLDYPSSGVRFSAPTNWSVQNQKAPLVVIVNSGTAVVAVWRFVRTSAAPAGAAAIAQAKAKLIGAVRARDASLQVIRANAVTVDRSSGIELDAIERIAGQVRRVRSTHVFVPGAELVLEEYAPPGLFHAVDHAVFSPLKRSLRLSAARA